MNEPKRKRLLFKASIALVAILSLIVIGSIINMIFFAGINRGPSLIEEMRQGTITESNIKSVEFLKRSIFQPFTQKEYDSLERTRISSAAAVKKLTHLLKSTSDGRPQNRNHPESGYDTIIKVTMQDGGVYYVYCTLAYYEEAYYVYVNANSRGSVNPNGAKGYESIPLAEFLKEHDPYYRGMLSN